LDHEVRAGRAKQWTDACPCVVRAKESPAFRAGSNASETKFSYGGRIDRAVFPFILDALNN
jgi:hypothetical protein